ncbi:hypothetical protein Tco_0800910 [Tanacetum coccineum]|uniref:Uncharacterized protein n=1 Tax=Tanacetum coccineum TaxID=301880 RepID=A0ABQ4ZYJ9_9ASTR
MSRHQDVQNRKEERGCPYAWFVYLLNCVIFYSSPNLKAYMVSLICPKLVICVVELAISTHLLMNMLVRVNSSTHCFAVAAAPRDVKDVWTVIVAAASSPIQSLLRLYCLFIFYVYRFERTKLCTYESVMYATC